MPFCLPGDCRRLALAACCCLGPAARTALLLHGGPTAERGKERSARPGEGRRLVTLNSRKLGWVWLGPHAWAVKHRGAGNRGVTCPVSILVGIINAGLLKELFLQQAVPCAAGGMQPSSSCCCCFSPPRRNPTGLGAALQPACAVSHWACALAQDTLHVKGHP